MSIIQNFDEANYYGEKSTSNQEMKSKIKTYLKKERNFVPPIK